MELGRIFELGVILKRSSQPYRPNWSLPTLSSQMEPTNPIVPNGAYQPYNLHNRLLAFLRNAIRHAFLLELKADPKRA